MMNISGFRPLAGIMVLIKEGRNYERYNNNNMFPSPCGDYGSYQVWEVGDDGMYTSGFRPLAGIMVLISLKHWI